MPILAPPDTLRALGGPGFPHCDSRSLFKDKFVFFDRCFDEDKRVALDLFTSRGRRDLISLRREWERNKARLERSRDEGYRFNENELRKSNAALLATNAFQEPDPSTISFDRSWLRDLPNSLTFTAETASRLLVGLANGVLENAGCTIHPRFGFPIIPGSALKGIARDAAEILKKRSDVICSIFGSSSDEEQPRQGDVAFLDAHAVLREGEVDLELDIVTPHFQSYYGVNGNENALDEESPIPNVFPAVAKGITFEFALIVHTTRISDAEAKDVLKTARECLEYALNHLGVGAKTASGYGRFYLEGTPKFEIKQDLFPPPVLSPKEEFLEQWSGKGGNTFLLQRLIADLSKVEDSNTMAELFDTVIPQEHLQNFRSTNPYWTAFLREGGKTILSKINRELPHK